jgi:hypothetical protein
MDLSNPIATICPDSHGRVLGALAHADEPLTRRQIALRCGLSHHGVERALDDLVAAGVVWQARLRPCYWHFLYREHLAAEAVLALADLTAALGRRIAAHAADWQPSAATLALRTPCPARTGPGGRALVDLLIVRPAAAEPADWDANLEALVEAVGHWSGNDTHLTVLDHPATPPAEPGELTAEPWWLLAGEPLPGLPFHAGDGETAGGGPPAPRGGLPAQPLGSAFGKPGR